MDGLLEYKSVFGTVKDVDKKSRVVTGYLSETQTKDYQKDVTEKGAFQKSINERKSSIFFLNQHKWDQPHGKFAVLHEDSKGLYFESEPLPNTTYSNDALELYALGIVNEHSYGYQAVKAVKQNDGGRILREVKLFEGSNVTLGMHPSTPFMGFKNRTIGELNDQVSIIMKAMRNGNFTDDTFLQLEIALKQLQLESYELGKKALEEPSDDDTQDNEPLIIEQIKSFRQSLKI